MNKYTPKEEGEPTYSVTDKNVLGEPLEFRSLERALCFFDQSYRLLDEQSDTKKDVVCVVITREFLEFAKGFGHDLEAPDLEQDFAGLKPGQTWYLSVKSWFEAYHAGCAPSVVLEATHQDVLTSMSSETLTALAQHSRRKPI